MQMERRNTVEWLMAIDIRIKGKVTCDYESYKAALKHSGL